MGAQKAKRVINAALRDELHVLGRANIFTEVYLGQLEPSRVHVPALLAAREVGLPLILRARDLPRKQARRQTDHLITLGAVTVRHGKCEHGLVFTRRIVDKGQAIRDSIHFLLERDALEAVAIGPCTRGAEKLSVSTGHVAAAHNVTHYENVLRLCDHRFRVASVVSLNGCKHTQRIVSPGKVCKRSNRV